MNIFKIFLLIVFILMFACRSSQQTSELQTKYEIIGIMHAQVKAWNSGNI